MPTTLRNQLKTRAQRDGEVLYHSHLKSGQADSQDVLNGCLLAPGTTNTALKLSAGEVLLGGLIVAIAALDNQALPAGATTAAGQVRKVLVEVNAAGVLSMKAGVAVTTVQADALLPAGDFDKITVGYLEIPASFTQGTTPVTVGMCKQVLYHA